MCVFCELKLAALNLSSFEEFSNVDRSMPKSEPKALNFETFNQKWGSLETFGTSGELVTFSFAEQNYEQQFESFDFFIREENFQREITQALTTWENISNIRFTLVPDSQEVDIRFGWRDIDGEGGILGSTIIPSSGPLENVIVAFDRSEKWFLDGDSPPNQIDFSSTAIHEIGHAIGIGHSSSTIALMNASYSQTIFTLQQDDIDAAVFIYGANDVEKVAVHRFFNPKIGGHFFTADILERDVVQQNETLNSEGVGFVAVARANEAASTSVPVYRFYNTELGSHFFTAFEKEKSHVMTLQEYVFEGIGFRGYDTDSVSTQPVHRFFNLETGGHFFTISEVEKNAVMSISQFRYEGEAFFAFADFSV